MQTHRFIREGSQWFIDLPEFLAQGGSKGDLQMVAGADTLLDIIAGDKPAVTLEMDTQPFTGADELTLTELCDPVTGGGYYRLNSFEGKSLAQDLWLCDVTRFVFNGIPPKIYIRRVESE